MINSFSRTLFTDKRLSWLWLLIRLYVGWQWLHAGWEKIGNPAWTGNQAGAAVKGFLMGALQKTSGPHPDVSNWYASLIQHVALPHVSTLSHVVAYGEFVVGIALILGLFTGLAAFVGAFMNLNYLFAGAVSINPLLLVLQFLLILAWRIAGWIGLDHWVLPLLRRRWHNN